MKRSTKPEISIEDYKIINDEIHIEWFNDNDFKEETFSLTQLETFVTDRNYLDWVQIIMREGQYVDQAEGTFTFPEWIKERLNTEILGEFISSLNQK